MKKILVPIDFSECSLNAFFYAKAFASTLGFSLKIIHIYSGEYSSPDLYLPITEVSRKEELNKRLLDFVNTLPKKETEHLVLENLEIETKLILALDPARQIETLTKDSEVAMVIIGTSGTSNIIDKLLGSVSSFVAQHAHCPVVLIPKGLEFNLFKNILYASNYESVDKNMIQPIIDFGSIFKSTLHFVHVEEKDNYERIENTIFDKLFEKGDPTFSFNIVNIRNHPVMEGLNQYAEENDIDLMVLVNRQRSYLDNFLQKSLTKKMASNTSIPLMIFHLLND